MILAKRLKELRKEKKISQEELSRLLEVSQPTYSCYENGTRKPSYDHLLVLSEYFNVSTDYLLGKSDVKATQAEVDFLKAIEEKGLEQLVHEYNLTLGNEKMDPKDEKILYKLIKTFMEKDQD